MLRTTGTTEVCSGATPLWVEYQCTRPPQRGLFRGCGASASRSPSRGGPGVARLAPAIITRRDDGVRWCLDESATATHQFAQPHTPAAARQRPTHGAGGAPAEGNPRGGRTNLLKPHVAEDELLRSDGQRHRSPLCVPTQQGGTHNASAECFQKLDSRTVAWGANTTPGCGVSTRSPTARWSTRLSGVHTGCSLRAAAACPERFLEYLGTVSSSVNGCSRTCRVRMHGHVTSGRMGGYCWTSHAPGCDFHTHAMPRPTAANE
jgi:hypothetical protein